MLIRMLCVLFLTASCWSQESGNWKMIPAKCRFSSSPVAKTITARYEAHSDAEIWTFYRVRVDGTSETISQTLRFDGKEYPCGNLGLEEMPDTVISRRLDARTAEVSYKKAGRVTRRVVRTLSADGKQMTLKVHVTTEEGPVLEDWLVFER
jgi:hypothetical protein